MMDWSKLNHEEQKAIMILQNDIGNHLLMEHYLKGGVIDWSMFKYGYNIMKSDGAILFVSEDINFSYIDLDKLTAYFKEVKEEA
jgi:hypothetical protein